MSRITLIILLVPIMVTAVARAGTVQNEIYFARDRVMPALVHIQPVVKNYNTGELEKQQVVGSGVIFHADGYVVTNYHVTAKAERILCTLADREIVPAEFVGGDPLTDIAVIKLDLSEYTGEVMVAEFGDSDSIAVGQYVIAMGSPLALSRSVSAGVISTKDRYFSGDVRLPTGERTGQYNLWIQTDAAINPGNSGGPLVDLSGRVIGINSRGTWFANNIGFAIPINIVKEATASILSQGKVIRSWIGVHCQALQELEDYFGTDRDVGVLVSSIDPGSPAEKSFLKAGDVILEVDDQPVAGRFVEELPAFYSLIAHREPGSEITLKVLRGDQHHKFKVVTKELGDLQGEDFECKGWGFTVKAITKQMQIDNQLEDTLGVMVIGVKAVSTADEGGLRRSDVVKKVDKSTINSLADFVEAYNNLTRQEAEKALLTIRRGGATRFVPIKIEEKTGEIVDEQ
ncbi:MAG: trypsin-like peptidase domain-containing protein [Candidatus Zixiibacteriota bacterium]|nr:MAG: trypsin-like peptidase domain-containing protein [candidate division Zixibacteria bacterium]